MGLNLHQCWYDYFLFSLSRFSSLWLLNSENSITVIHKSIPKFYFCEFTILLTKKIPFFSNRPKFPAYRLKSRAKVRKVKNSKKIFKLQIKEREQVSRNGRRFNVSKTKKDLRYFQQVCEGAPFISKNAHFRPKLPHLTLMSSKIPRPYMI